MSLNTWDLVKDGATLVTFGSFIKLESTAEATVTDQPIEEGSFNSVNKVASPERFTVQLALTGTTGEIAAAVQTINAEVKEASKLQVISPHGATPESSLVKLQVQASRDNFYSKLVVTLTLQEIKEVPATYTATEVNTDSSSGSGGASKKEAKPIKKEQAKNPSDVSNQNTGKAQAEQPKESVAYKAFKTNNRGSTLNFDEFEE